MTSYNVFTLLKKQLERHIAGKSFRTKVIMTPSSVSEKGILIKISLLKTFTQNEPKHADCCRMIRVKVSVCGTAESLTGLEQACAAIESLDDYLSDTNKLRLENEDGTMVPNTRFIQQVSPEDSFMDNPDSTDVQDVQDERILTIYFPWEKTT